MKKFRLIALPILFPFLLAAQNAWQADSAWVSNMLERKDTIHINPEYLKAIQEGTFINTGKPLKSAPSDLPILKDFSAYIQADTSHQLLRPDSLPPAVFLLYPPDSIRSTIRKEAYTTPHSWRVRDRIQLGPLYGTIGAQNLFQPEIKDGQRRGSVGISVGAVFSFEDILRKIFWTNGRNRKKNSK